MRSSQSIDQSIERDIDIDDALDKIAHKKSGCGAALRAFRERANYTQKKIAGRFSRASTTWVGWEKDPPQSWPSRQLLIRALTDFGLSREQLSLHFDLRSSPVMQFEDPLIFRWELHEREMPKLLVALYSRAQEGSDHAARLLIEDYRRTQDEMVARESKAIAVSSRKLAQRAAWLKGRSGETVQIEATTSSSGSTVESESEAAKLLIPEDDKSA